MTSKADFDVRLNKQANFSKLDGEGKPANLPFLGEILGYDDDETGPSNVMVQWASKGQPVPIDLLDYQVEYLEDITRSSRRNKASAVSSSAAKGPAKTKGRGKENRTDKDTNVKIDDLSKVKNELALKEEELEQTKREAEEDVQEAESRGKEAIARIMAEANEKIKEVESRGQEAITQIREESKQKANAAAEEIASLKAKLSQKKKEAKEAKQEVHLVEYNLDFAKKGKKEAEEKLSALAKDFKDTTKAIDVLEKANAVLENAKTDLKVSLETAEGQTVAIEKKFQTELKAKTELKASLETAKGESGRFQTELRQWKEAADGRMKGLVTTVGELKKSMAKAKGRRLQKEAEHLQKEADLQQENAALKAHLEVALAKINDLKQPWWKRLGLRP